MTNDEVPKYPKNDEIPKAEGRSYGVAVTQEERISDKPGGGRPCDLAERTALFGEAVIDFLRKVPVNPITRCLIDQLSGAGTSVGANYCEADDAPSKKAFRNSIATCKREAREAKFFIRMIVHACPESREEARPIWQQAKELHVMFCKIYRG